MSALTNTGENLFAKVFFQKATATGVMAGATGVASWYVSLHTASPGETASGAEIAYGSYARVAVARTATGWTVTGAAASPAANVDFPACTSGTTGTATHFALWTAATGGTCYVYGAITPNIAVSVGVTPRLTTSSTVTFA
jgi:hypothetical protein